MKVDVLTWRTVGTPELVEALTDEGYYATVVDAQPTLDSHLRAAEAVLLKLGYRRRDYVLVAGTAPGERVWRFTFARPDEFTKPSTQG